MDEHYWDDIFSSFRKTIHAISEILLSEYEGKVPSTSEDLMKLPGVGIKTANLTLNLGFGIEAICVDCHVHRIANRMGWLHKLLVIYGQLICTSIRAWCSKCPQQQTCPKAGVEKSR